MLPQANLSLPRTREFRRGEADGYTGMDARFRGHDDSEESLRPQPMMLGKGGAKAGAPALTRLRRRSVLHRFVSSRLTDAAQRAKTGAVEADANLMPKSLTSLRAVRDEIQLGSPPLVMFNKSHSGSRLLAKVLAAAGVFMGAHRNESEDSLDMLDLVEYLVREYYPDYTSLWQAAGLADSVLPDLIRDVVRRHLEGFDPIAHRRWGWKLCETTYIIPVVDFLFPGTQFIHLIRDGRDVAFCNQHAPSEAFWKKIYFDTPHIVRWRGRQLTRRAYRNRSYIYNAQHWLNSVRVGRTYGAMLRERYLEVRYEDVCTNFAATVQRVLAFAGVEYAESALAEVQSTVRTGSIHKYRSQPWWRVRQVLRIIKPELLCLGYLPPEDGVGG
jgi:hypothetical protein